MSEEIKKVITVETGKAETSLKDYKKAIDKLRASLLELDSTSEEYKEIAEELKAKQEKLSEVMSVGKTSSTALAGSYNDLVNQLKALRTAWRETNDEATRTNLGKQMLDINNQLKDLDASVGNYSRNVGNYSESFQSAFLKSLEGLTGIKGPLKDVSTMFANLIPTLNSVKATGVGTFTAIKTAISSTGIGLFIVAIGQAIQLLGDLWQKMKDNAEAAKEKMKEVQAAYDEGYSKMNDKAEEFYSNETQQTLKSGREVKEIKENADRLLEAAEEKHQQNMEKIRRDHQYDRDRVGVARLLVQEQQRYQQEIENIMSQSLSNQLNTMKKYDGLKADSAIKALSKQLDNEKKAEKARIDLLKAQARSEIKDKTKLNETLLNLDRQYYNNALNLQNNYINALKTNFNKNLPQVQEALREAGLELNNIEVTRLDFETNAEETARQIKSAMSTAGSAVDKFEQQYKRAVNEIDYDLKKKIFITERDVTDEIEKATRIANARLEGIEKLIEQEERYKKQYNNNADKVLESESKILDYEKQRLEINRDIAKTVDGIKYDKLQEDLKSLQYAAERTKQTLDAWDYLDDDETGTRKVKEMKIQYDELNWEINRINESLNEFDPLSEGWIKAKNQLLEVTDKAHILEKQIAQLDDTFLNSQVEKYTDQNEQLKVTMDELTETIAELEHGSEEWLKTQEALNNATTEYYTNIAKISQLTTMKLKKDNEQQAKDDEEKWKRMRINAMAWLNTSAQIFSAMSDLMEEQSTASKVFATMDVVASQSEAAMRGYLAGVATIKIPAWAGQALGVANIVAASLQGAAQIKRIWSTSKDNPTGSGGSAASGAATGASISAVGVNPLLDEQMDIERLQRLQMYGDSETEKDTRVYVVESDIEDVKNRVQVRESNATF